MRRTSLMRLMIVTGAFLLLYVVATLVAVRMLSKDLPDLMTLEQIRPKLSTVVYSADGQALKTFAVQKRTLLPYEDFPPVLVNALLASEDREFWDHWGVNVLGIARAAFKSVITMRPARATSTITQQLARDLFLTKERSLVRKAKEAILAVRIERTYTKREILQLYLNQVYFGSGAYGIQAAARTFFGKDAKDLNAQEAATLVGMLPAPNFYSPTRHADRSIRRRNIVLLSMERTGGLTREKADSLRALPLVTTPAPEELGIAPYFTEYVRLRLGDQLDASPELRARFAQALGLPDSVTSDQIIYEGGLAVETTLDSRLQAVAERAVGQQVDSLQAYFDRCVRFGGCRDWVDRERSAELDSTVAKPVQAALVALDVHTGAIRAMVGGRDFDVTKFNRAVQALRQPGSAFKPFVYAAAIDNGFTPVSELPNQPVTIPSFVDGKWGEWQPENYDGTVGGLTTLREGLRHSINLVAIRLLQQIGPQLAIQYAQSMGITSPLPPYLSLALGVGEVRLLELTSAFSVFADQGIHVDPFPVMRVTSRDGIELLPRMVAGHQRQALSPQTAFIMAKLLEDVVDHGTGVNARLRYGFTRPAGGKTGTTNDYGDAWFIGFTPQLVCGVWVGFDQRVSMGKEYTGAGAALPIWARFMKEAYDVLGLPVQDFPMPEGVVAAQVCSESHQLATPYCPSTYTEYFREGEPPPPCTIHGPGGERRVAPTQESDDSGMRRRF